VTERVRQTFQPSKIVPDADNTTEATVRLPIALAVMSLFLAGVLPLTAQKSVKDAIIPLPPMGWSSWNSFSNTIDSQIVMDQAKAMASSGMQKAGYRYINIDEGWWLGERDAQGNIVVPPQAWPALTPSEHAGDMSNIVRYIHGLGLKAGIYTDAGMDGCSTVGPDLGPSYPHTGSEGHYEQDFLQIAKWGFDYVKVDWCGGDKENLDPAIQYAEIARAIARAESITGHRLYYSICNWGKHSPWTWAPNIGGVTADIWRTGGDIVAPIVANTKNADRKAEFKDVLREFDAAFHPQAQHTGFYNDPDMMVVGMQGLTDAQSRAHMSLWAILGGPLLVGADLTKLTPAAVATLTNREVLAIDQDALGLQALKVSEPAAGLEVWSKPLSTPGRSAVLLLNRTNSDAQIAVTWADLGLIQSSSATVRDIWANKNLGATSSSYSATVPAGDIVLLLVNGKKGKLTSYKAGAESKQSEGGKIQQGQQVSFKNVASRTPFAPIRITYTNPDKTPRFAELRVNGQIATRIAFPSTGSDGQGGTIWIEALLDQPGPANALTFSSSGDPGPVIESISVQ
jgi:hypothetical protein